MIEELKGYCSDCRLSTYRSPQQCDSADKCVVTDWDAIAAELPVPAGIITKHTRIYVRPGARPFILK